MAFNDIIIPDEGEDIINDDEVITDEDVTDSNDEVVDGSQDDSGGTDTSSGTGEDKISKDIATHFNFIAMTDQPDPEIEYEDNPWILPAKIGIGVTAASSAKDVFIDSNSEEESDE